MVFCCDEQPVWTEGLKLLCSVDQLAFQVMLACFVHLNLLRPNKAIPSEKGNNPE